MKWWNPFTRKRTSGGAKPLPNALPGGPSNETATLAATGTTKTTRTAEGDEGLPSSTPSDLVPILWLLGKAQSGKSTIVRYLTGAERAVVGDGFRPQTRASFLFDFPSADAPLMRFFDTRGLGEIRYDPAEDIDRFNQETNLLIVVVKALDHALEPIIEPLRAIRAARPDRPVLLVLTCLHEAYPGEPHPEGPTNYPKASGDLKSVAGTVQDNLRRSLQTQLDRFDGLFDEWVAIDITPPDEGFDPWDYGGEELKGQILKLLPAAYGHALAVYLKNPAQADAAFLRIMVAANAAGLASLTPIPWVDLPIITAIQIGMAVNLASLYGKSLSIDDSKSLILRIGGALALRQGARELLKLIPVVGSILNAAFAFSVTFALGKTLCWYFERRDKPTTDELEKQFAYQLKQARTLWKRGGQSIAR